MPQTRLGSSMVKRSKRCRARTSPYHKEQGRTRNIKETVGSPTGFLSNHRPTSNQLEIIKCLLLKTWHLYHLSPLWLFSSDTTKLRNYSQQLTRHIHTQVTVSSSSMQTLQYMAKIASLPGFGLDGSEAIEITIRQRQSRRNSPELVALLLKVNDTQMDCSEGFSSFPMMLVHGSVHFAETTLQWLQSSFDCHITPFKLTNDELSTLVSEHASSDGAASVRGSRNIELVYSLPDSIRKAGLSTIAVELPQDSAAALWEAGVQEGEEESRRDNKLFVEKLNEYIHKHFHLKLESLTLSRISTPVLHADSIGRLKFKSPKTVIPVLSMLQSYMS